MVLVTEDPQKFQNHCCIENLDTLTGCQFLEHSIHDYQAAAKDGVIADDKFYAIHRFRCKKKRLGVPRLLGGFRDVVVWYNAVLGESLCYVVMCVKLFQEAARRLRP